MNTIPGYLINPSMDDGTTIIRRARKQHYCAGGHDGRKRTKCAESIPAGSLYVEYVGESPLYESGYHYHAECAKQQGLLIQEDVHAVA